MLDFGCVPDGKTDCTAQMQHAIDFCTMDLEEGQHSIPGCAGRTLLVPPGTYVFGQVHWAGSLHIKGMGGTLKMTSDVGSVFGHVPYVWFHGMPRGEPSKGSPLTGVVKFEDVIFDGSCTPAAIKILPGYSDGHYITHDPTSSWAAGFMIGLENFLNVELRGCRMLNFIRGCYANACTTAIMNACTTDCVDCQGQLVFGPERCERVEFTNNVCLGCTYTEIFQLTGTRSAGACSSILPRGSMNIIINGNNSRGHQLVVQAGDICDANGPNPESRCVVANNIIDWPPADTAVYGYEAVICCNNISRRSGDVGFSFDGSRYITCSNNVVEGANTAGITIFNAEGCVMNDNVVQDFGQAYPEAYITAHYPPSEWSVEIMIGIRICGLIEGDCAVVMKECVVSGNSCRMTKPLWWTSKYQVSTAAVVVGYGNKHNTFDSGNAHSQTCVVQGNVATANLILFPDFSITVVRSQRNFHAPCA
eukprot:SAG31_NODE_6619_length_1949_cov_1.066486_2_plen_476_part_00